MSLPTAAEIQAAQKIHKSIQSKSIINKLGIQEIKKTKSAIIWDYELYIVETLLLIAIIGIVWIRSFYRQQAINTRMADVINFVNSCKSGTIPYNDINNIYTGPDGETLAYYYVYPHSFLNPFVNINYPAAVVESFYSNTLGECFTHVGDYVQIMLVYSQLNGKADAETIICQTYANPYADPNLFCPSLYCRQVCQPVGETSLVDSIAFWGPQMAFVGVMGQKAGSKVISSLSGGEEVATQAATGVSQGIELTTFASEPVAQIVGEGAIAPAISEGALVTTGTTEALVGTTTTTAEAAAGTEAAATLGTSVEAGVEIGATAGSAEPGLGNVIGAAIGATIGLCIGIGIAVGTHESQKQKNQSYCDANSQYCIESAATGCPEEE